eukprot:TRINITY_DN106455_c0_g1_i1.p1 TRINITY_DN106455_c0_g1~~TRINITY_DN106455_c0_g1_i1.p1  ORF type:complete len:404 (-),score=75.25 TRINITY_DN106455_c0_g1_i1:4-1215(-)
MAKCSSAFGRAVRTVRPTRSLSVSCVNQLWWPSNLASPVACSHLMQGERIGFGRYFAAQVASAEAAVGEATPVGELISFLQELRRAPLSEDEKDPEGPLARYDAAGTSLQRRLIDGEISDRVSVLKALAELGTVPGRPFPIAVHFLFFLEEYVDILETLRDGETIADRATELREVLLCFHRAGLSPDRLKQIYAHIERDFPQFEAASALLPMPAAVQLCHTMLATGLSSPAAVLVLLRSALREPLLHVADDSQELRLLKTIEILIRLDYLHTQEQMTPDVLEYLSVIRDLRYYDRELRRETALSYQMAYFLRKHGFPAKRKMLGPYVLKVCDPDERINFEPVEERNWRFGLVEEPPARKKRHLEAVGWRCIEVQAATWRNLPTYDAKAGYIRQLLKDSELLTL